MRSLDRFNKVARIYDTLAQIVFGKRLDEAQRFYLESIPAHSKVLIIGGGTGGLLRVLLDLNPSCEVWYLEASSSMIAQARRKMGEAQASRVHFIHGTEQNIPDGLYDAVITHFFLDLFSAAALDEVIATIQGHLRHDAVWLVCDFVDRGKWWQRMLLRVMYLFFRIVCSLDARRLPPWELKLSLHGFAEVNAASFFGSFIRSAVMMKKPQ
jgi:tRNA (cmo5U34)-methyltransferase